MAFESTMLQAIQNVSGNNKAEKLEYIFRKGNEIAAKGIGWGSIPPAFHPLVNVELAKKLRKNELIIEALKSEDATIVNRALHIDNLFLNDSSPLMRFDYFNHEILAHVSLKTRFKVIKKVAENLIGEDPELGQKFFLGILGEFGVEFAVPLLHACGEDFMYEQIIKHRIILSTDFVMKLYKRYPNVAIKYLKLGMNVSNRQYREIHIVKLENYCIFFPTLMENHFDEFIEFCKASTPIPLKLSKKKTMMFLQKGTTALIQEPKIFWPILNLEAVTKQLNPENFEAVVRGLLPKDISDFKDSTVLKYLEHYPKSSQGNFIRSIFNDVYKFDLYDRPELISRELLALIPAGDRVRIARLKVETDFSWSCNSYYPVDFNNVSWWCFLPAEETIPKIKDEISRCSSFHHRRDLIIQMLLCCTINDNNSALLTALQYLARRHGNEDVSIFEYTFESLQTRCDLYALPESHWNVINEIVHQLVIKHDNKCLRFLIGVLKHSIHYKLDRDMAIDDDIKVIISVWTRNLHTFFDDHPRYERKCLDTFIKHIKNEDISLPKFDILSDVLSAIEYFNDKNKKKRETSALNFKDYNWIMQTIDEYVEEKKSSKFLNGDIVKRFPAVFDTFMRNGDFLYDVHNKQIVDALKTDSSIILKHWDSYVDELLGSTGRSNHFVEAIRWYQDLPINLAERALQAIHEKKSPEAFRILGLLLQGPEYEEIFDSVIGQETTLFDKDKTEAKTLEKSVRMFFMTANECSPPVSFKVFKKLIIGDFKMEAVKYLYGVVRKISRPEVFNFAEFLMGRKEVSIKKHGIRLMCMVSSLDRQCAILTRLWESDSHRTVRGIVILKLRTIFAHNPSEKRWEILETCLQQRAIDDEEVIEQLTQLKLIPTEYVLSYIEHVLGIVEDFGKLCKKKLIENVLNQIDKTYAEILPADFQLELIKKYFLDSAMEKDGVEMNKRIIFEVCLTGPELDSKLSVFMENLVNFLRTHLDDDECRSAKLLNALIADFGRRTANGYKQPKITKALKQIFESILTPFDDPNSFLLLSWIEKYEEAEYCLEKFGKIAGLHIESVTSIFGEKLYVIVADSFVAFVNSFPRDAGDYEVTMFNVIDSLFEIDNVGCLGVATKLYLYHGWGKKTTEWNKISEKLKMIDFPIVKSLLRHETLN